MGRKKLDLDKQLSIHKSSLYHIQLTSLHVLILLGKELGKCTHQRTTNEEKNKRALSTLRVFFRLKKKDRQQQKEERSREEDRREGGNQGYFSLNTKSEQ